MDKRYGWGHLIAAIATVTVVWAVCLIFTPQADADEPYGGCKETYQVLDGVDIGSKAVSYCRAHGWIVRRNLVVDPYGAGVTTVRRCTGEDDTVCYWNARTMGNGYGSGYVALHGRTIYLDSVNGVWVSTRKNRLGMWVVKPWLS